MFSCAIFKERLRRRGRIILWAPLLSGCVCNVVRRDLRKSDVSAVGRPVLQIPDESDYSTSPRKYRACY
jgi:hypothetical protein